MAYTLDINLALGAANTGLTLEAQLVNTAGANVGAVVATGFVEIGAGNYLWHYAAFPDGHRGGVVFRVSGGGAIKSFVGINPEEVENPDIKTSSVAAAVWVNATRTLTSFGTLVADTAAAVWAFGTRTLTTAIAAVTPPPVVTGDQINIRRGDTIVIPFTGLGSLVGRTKLWFTVRADPNAADTASVIQIEETGGLLFLNGAVATAGQGSLVVNNAALGDLTVTLQPVAAAQLVLSNGLFYDVQSLIGGVVATKTSGRLAVNADVTRAVS